MLLYQVAIDSPGGDTSNSKMSELGYYKHVHYKLALMCAKNRIIILCSLLDIRENNTLALMCAKNCVNIFDSFLDIRQNAVASFLLAHPGPSWSSWFVVVIVEPRRNNASYLWVTANKLI